jgi:hypothetical protein
MQLQAVGLKHGVEKPMRWQTKSSLVQCHTHHDIAPHWSRRCKIHGHKTGSKLRHCHIPLTYNILQVLSCNLRRGLTRLRHETRKGIKTTPCKLNNSLLFFHICFSISAFFSAVGKEAEEWGDIM